MEKKFNANTDFELWSKELTDGEKKRLCSSVFNDKDLSSDFEWLHYDNYVENDDMVGNKHQLAFYNSNCLWQLDYTAYESGTMALRCLYFPSNQAYEKSFNDISELLCGEPFSDWLIQHTTYNCDGRNFIVEYLYIDE